MKKLLNQAWTVVMVSVITLLVWLYAEDANVKSYNNERVFVRFVAPDDGEMLIDPPGATVLVSLTGSNGQYQQFSRRVDDSQVIEIPVPISPGQLSASAQIDMRRELEEGLLANLGLNLTELDQDNIDVSVQRVVEVPIDVRVEAQGLNLARPAESTVQQITVRLPATLATEAVHRSTATIDLASADLRSVTPGSDSRLTLPIVLPDTIGDLPDGFDPRMSAAEAVVTFRLVIEREPYTIERLFVKLTSPASVGNRYAIEVPAEYQFLAELQVQGPPAQIALLRENPGSPNILATVELTNAEADEAAVGTGVVTKPVQIYINLPGVELVSEPPRIPIEVRLRDAEPTTP